MKNTLLIYNAKITTMDPLRPEATAVLISGDRIAAVGDDSLLAQVEAECTRIDAGGRRLIPGLNDSHIHGVRQGLNHAMELRWDAQTSLGAALERLRNQAQNTPPGQWVRVVGGWSFRQFSERRHPTIDEINAATGDVPCYVLHLYDYAIVNRAGLRALGIGPETRDTYPRGRIIRDSKGNPTGLMLAAPSAVILYSLLNQMPKLAPEEQAVSTRHFFRELNRFGLTSLLDAGGGFLNYPEDYDVLTSLHREDLLSVRIGFSLFASARGKSWRTLSAGPISPHRTRAIRCLRWLAQAKCSGPAPMILKTSSCRAPNSDRAWKTIYFQLLNFSPASAGLSVSMPPTTNRLLGF